MKEYLIIEKDSIAERVVGDAKKLVMSYSESDIWNDSCKGEEIATLKDTGNDIKISIGGKKITLDYQQFCNLHNLFNIKMIADPDMREDTKLYIIDK